MVNKLVKKILLKVTPKKLISFYISNSKKENTSLKYATISYSQEGEDLIINRFLENKKNGFYVDIGAHHPKRFSNTYNFYKRGWKGINIDAMPGSMEAFNIERPRDTNIETGVSKEKQELIYYIFNEPALNTFCKKEAEKKDGLNSFKIIKKEKVLTFPLAEILNTYMPNKVDIDFMSIDVEGLDLEVLESNDWNKYRPYLLLVEDLKKKSLESFQSKSPVFQFLNEKKYELVAKTFNTYFFKDTSL